MGMYKENNKEKEKEEKFYFPDAIVILVSWLDRNRYNLNLVNLENLKMYRGGIFWGCGRARKGIKKKKEKREKKKKRKTYKTRHPCPARAEYWSGRQELCKLIITNNPYVKKGLMSSQITKIDRSVYLTGCLQQPIRRASERSIIVQMNKKPI